MKPQQILNKLAKYNEVQKVELSVEEPIKVEFAMEDYLSQIEKEFDKGLRIAKELEKTIDKVKQDIKPLRDGVYDSENRLAEIRNKAEAEITEIVKQAKKLGLDSSDAYKTWMKVKMLSSEYAQKLDRYFQRGILK